MSARQNIIPVFVPHLGCPNDCVFCNQRRISGEQEPATAETVKTAVEQATELKGSGLERQIAFYGGSFTAIDTEQQLSLLDAAKEFLDKGEISSIRLSTRPDAINDAILERLKAYGVETIELGAQSLDNEILRLAARGHSAEHVVNASGLIKSFGFKLILQMMTGLPGDTGEQSIETAKRIIELQPDGVRIYPTVIVRDTALYEMWQRGRYKEHTVEDAVKVCAAIVPLFEEAGIPIIRLGLNPTDELSGGAAVGGAYHPALGELVKSRIMYEKACTLLEGVKPGSFVTIAVAPSKVSQMIGQHRGNVERLCERFKLNGLKVNSADIGINEIKIINIEEKS